MVYLSEASQIENLSSELMLIAIKLHEAIKKQHNVEMRVEDLPKMDLDYTSYKELSEFAIDEENKCIHVESSEAIKSKIMFRYKTISFGTESSSHFKFYVQSEGASITFVIRF